ncbi:DegT/DnrJ/EryC1/StrS family aminotransferase [Candidatus Poribacteria bacterium]
MAILAINGGPKTINRTLGKSWPIFGKEEEDALLSVLHSGHWFRRGALPDSPVTQFEDAFAAYQNAKYCVAICNGTQALEVALLSAGVQPGDEVIVPAASFIAVASTVCQVGAVPIFVDIDPETFNIDPAAAEAAITARTTAIMAVHNGGLPCDMDSLRYLCQRKSLRLVEDCAHAHGSRWDGVGVGAIGDAGGFSFQVGKTLPAGEGGAVLSNDEKIAGLAYALQNMSQYEGRPYCGPMMASNRRMSEWQGALLNVQFTRLDEQTNVREANASYLGQGLSNIPGVDPVVRHPKITAWGFYFLNLRFNSQEFDGITRDRFVEAIQAEGLGAALGHSRPMYTQEVFQRHPDCLPRGHAARDYDYSSVHCEKAEYAYANTCWSLTHRLFLGPREDMDLILEAVQRIRDNVDELR